MKSSIIAKFEEMLQTEDIASVKAEIKPLISEYNAFTSEERKSQLAAWKEEEHEEGDEFQFVPNELDAKFNELVGNYKERVKEHGRIIAEKQKANLVLKKDLLVKFEELIKTEENIGKAFADFNEIKASWDAVGDIPGDTYRETQDKYFALKEEFFYNINIYKALEDNFLKKNLQLKEELIEKSKALAEINEVSELEMLVRSYQKQWQEIGPSPRETYKELGDTFFANCREAYGKIQAHYDGIRNVHAENLAKKNVLIDNLKVILEEERASHSDWTKSTDKIKEIQKNWKEIGFSGKAENESTWQEFRSLCDMFFEKKKNFYDDIKASHEGNKQAKIALIEKAKSLQENTDWKKTTEAYINLQKEWKTVGAIPQRDEQKLWQKFRASCDKFFNAKSAFFDGLGDKQEENKQQKLAVIEEIKAVELSGNQGQDVQMLRDLSAKWNSIGHVPKKDLQPLYDAYNAALDEKYGKLKVERKEKMINQYSSRVQKLKNSDGAPNLLKKEQYLLRDKIDRLKQRIIQYENNMGFFTGSGADAMKKEYNKKIDVAQKEIDEIKEKLKLLRES